VISSADFFGVALGGRLQSGRVQADQINEEPLYQPSGEHQIRVVPDSFPGIGLAKTAFNVAVLTVWE
jgi:hypothetical protein